MKYNRKKMKLKLKGFKKKTKVIWKPIRKGMKEGYEETRKKIKPYKPKIKKRIKKIVTYKRGKEINRFLAKPVRFPKLI